MVDRNAPKGSPDDSERTIEMLPEEMGERYLDFVIKGEIGRGGFGVVKLAREQSARRESSREALAALTRQASGCFEMGA